MGIKYFCDRCGVSVSGVNALTDVTIPRLMNQPTIKLALCGSCLTDVAYYAQQAPPRASKASERNEDGH